MKKSGWQGDPIDVVNANGKNYIIDGHHRAAAAKRAGIDVPINVVDDVAAHRSGWRSVDEIVNDSLNVGADKLRK